MTVKFTNNASTTVGTGINASATSLTVASASSFPSLSGADDYCYLTIQQSTGTVREVVKATALSSNTFTIVRAQDNTSAGTWAAGDIVELRMTAALLTDVIDAATVEGVKTNFQYTPTAGQTVFSGADNASNTLIINQAALVSVYMNGVRLVQGTDYSVSSANNTVTLTVGATTADIIDIEVFGNFTGQSGAAVAITGGAISGTSVAATTLSASGTATLNTFVSSGVTISGGSLDGVTIGGTTRGDISGNAISGTSFASTGNMTFGDNDKAIFGAGSDLQIYHTGAYSLIADTSGTGPLRVVTNTFQLNNAADTQNMINAAEGGAVTLYNAGNAKLATTATGIQVTGDISNTSGDLTLDVAGDITFDADGGDWRFKDAGTTIATYSNVGGSWYITSNSQDGDIVFQGNDGGSTIAALTLDMSTGGTAFFADDVRLTDNHALRLGTDGDIVFYHDNSNGYLENGTGNLTLDVAGQIILDADTQGSGNGILLKDAGTLYGSIFRSSSHLHIKSEASDKDMLFMGNDGGSEITALTLDMSNAGAATFNGNITVNGGNAAIGTSGGGNGLGALISKGAVANFYEAYDGTKTMIAGTDAGNDYVKIGSLSAHPVGFVVGNAEKVRITSAGNVLVGTSTVAYAGTQLNIGSTSDAESGVQIQSATNGTGYVLFGDGASAAAYRGQINYVHATDHMAFHTAGAEAVRITSTGNFLAGNTIANPASGFNNQKGLAYTFSSGKVEIATTADAPALEIGKNNANDGDLVSFRKQSNVVGSIGVDSSDNMYIASSATNHVGLYLGGGGVLPMNSGSLDSGDNVDIGSPNYQFADGYLSGNLLVGGTSTNPTGQNVAGAAIDSSGEGNFSVDGAEALRLNRKTSEGDILKVMAAGATVGSIGVSGGNNLFISGQAADHAGFTFATQSILPTTQGALNNNTVDLGQNGNGFKDAYISGGVYLGGVGAANKLEDYETGTFTATLVGSTSQPSPQKTGTGYYTKIGRSVEITISFENVDTTGYAGQVTVSGVPFANNYGRAILSIGSYNLVTWTSQVIGVMQNSSSVVELLDIRSGAAWAITGHSAGTTRYLWINGVFQTNS